MERQELDIRTLWQALRRSWTTFLFAFLACVALAGVIAVITPKKYQSSSSVILRRSNDGGNTPAGAMATEVAIAHSVPVATRVQKALNLNEPVEQFLKRYNAVARTDDVLVFEATAPSSEEAVAMADTLANEFLIYRREQDTQQVDVLRQSLSGRITQLQSDIADLDKQIAAAGSTTPANGATSATASRLLESRQTLVSELGTLQGQISTAELQATISGEGSKVVEPASPPPGPVQPNVRFNLLLGILGGLAVGVAIVVVRELASSKLRNRHDIAVAAGASVLRSIRFPGRGRKLRLKGGRVRKLWEHPSGPLERSVSGVVSELGVGRTADGAVVSSVEAEPEAAFLVLSMAKDMVRQGRRPLVGDISDGPSPVATMLKSLGLLDATSENREPYRWFLPPDQGGKGGWSGFTTGSLRLLSARSRRWTLSSRATVLGDADVLLVHAGWSGTDEPPTLNAPPAAHLPGLLVVAASRSATEAIRHRSEALDQLASGSVSVVVVQPDRFDETTGQLEPPQATGATPLRGRAVES